MTMSCDGVKSSDGDGGSSKNSDGVTSVVMVLC